tara:strand:- start:92 stop:523 length:432 start_codon:yes stop_codon:yes gene_type:complete
MLGGGNPVGGNPAGIGTSLNYLGTSRSDKRDNFSGYSGAVVVNNSTATMLEFKAPPIATIATFVFTTDEVADANKFIGFKISVDEQIVYDARFYNRSSGGASGVDLDVPLILAIAGESNVKIEAQTDHTQNTTTYSSIWLKEI